MASLLWLSRNATTVMMTTYADLFDELVHLQEQGVDDTGTNDAKCTEATAMDLAMDGDASGLRLWLRQHPELRVNTRDPTSGRSLLHQACADGHKEVVKMLLEDTDASLMLRTMLGGSMALHVAVTNNHRSIVFQLLSHGADALARDKFGCSPMHYVKSVSVAKLLVQYGGRVLDYNARRKSALDSIAMFEAVEDADSDTLRTDRTTRKGLHKYLKQIAEAEYMAKLNRLREQKQQTRV